MAWRLDLNSKEVVRSRRSTPIRVKSRIPRSTSWIQAPHGFPPSRAFLCSREPKPVRGTWFWRRRRLLWGRLGLRLLRLRLLFS
jgi:hypothetical protein